MTRKKIWYFKAITPSPAKFGSSSESKFLTHTFINNIPNCTFQDLEASKYLEWNESLLLQSGWLIIGFTKYRIQIN